MGTDFTCINLAQFPFTVKRARVKSAAKPRLESFRHGPFPAQAQHHVALPRAEDDRPRLLQRRQGVVVLRLLIGGGDDGIRRAAGLEEGRAAGREEGREEERKKTLLEKERADKAEQYAAELEKQLAALSK